MTTDMDKLIGEIQDAVAQKRISNRIEANGFRWLAEDEVYALIRKHQAEQQGVDDSIYITEMLEKHADRADMFQPATDVIETRWVKLMRPADPVDLAHIEREITPLLKSFKNHTSDISIDGILWASERRKLIEAVLTAANVKWKE